MVHVQEKLRLSGWKLANLKPGRSGFCRRCGAALVSPVLVNPTLGLGIACNEICAEELECAAHSAVGHEPGRISRHLTLAELAMLHVINQLDPVEWRDHFDHPALLSLQAAIESEREARGQHCVRTWSRYERSGVLRETNIFRLKRAQRL